MHQLFTKTPGTCIKIFNFDFMFTLRVQFMDNYLFLQPLFEKTHQQYSQIHLFAQTHNVLKGFVRVKVTVWF